MKTLLKNVVPTQMLASVTNVEEALMALSAGVDIIDLKNPSEGALGALPISLVTDIVTAINGRAMVSATIGDLAMDPDLIVDATQNMQSTGVDVVKIGFFGASYHLDCLQALKPLASKSKLIAVLFADEQPDIGLLAPIADAGFYGAMLDTAKKSAGNLLDYLSMEDLASFAKTAAHLGLRSGMAGALRLPNVPALLGLQTSYLGFRGALCDNEERQSRLMLSKVQRLKSAISGI